MTEAMREGDLDDYCHWIPRKCPKCGSQLLKVTDEEDVFCWRLSCHFGVNNSVHESDLDSYT